MYWMDAAGLYTDEPSTQKLRKAPEINALKFRPTCVISRSGVRIRPPAPTQLNMGEFQSGQMGQTVNLLAMPSVVRIHLPPPKQPEQLFRLFVLSGYFARICLEIVTGTLLRQGHEMIDDS